MKEDNIYMRRALELATLGVGQVYSNPMVGAVLVYQGRIIGEGYHHRYGEPHAEVMAIRSVAECDLDRLVDSTLYVTLEPCSHYGKTPPCAELIIRHRISRVVIAQLDPYPEVAGRGIALLKAAGIEVQVGCLEAEARQLNKAFNTRYQMGRPYVLLKWAESDDGYMDLKRPPRSGQAVLFSSPYQQRLVHKLRREYQAIMVGAATALQDDPSLTNRYWGEVQPIRIILDLGLSLPQDLRVFCDNLSPTWVIYDRSRVPEAKNTKPQVRYIGLDLSLGNTAEIILDFLASEGINSLLVEGGGKTLSLFAHSGCYDQIQRERSCLRLGSGVPAPCLCPED